MGGRLVPDVAWAYDFPTREVLPIAGLVAFYNEKVDIILAGARLERPVTHFSSQSSAPASSTSTHPSRQPTRAMPPGPAPSLSM